VRVEDLVDLDWFIAGSPDDVAEKITSLHQQSGGFGTLLMVTGKHWADRELRHRSIRSFIENVAPQLRNLHPAT
jgi:alkanesulfonate monooxygenase SsuD/methylene tetrahydromethanopterin reductase-like flavin-dependent oxidoreductase (luciferase family)